MKAHHNNQPNTSAHGQPEGDPALTVFESMHSDLQRHLDQSAIVAFNSGRLICKNQFNGELCKPDKIFVPSLTYLTTQKTENGVLTYEIQGGWVNRVGAKQLVAEQQLKEEKRKQVAKHTSSNAMHHLFGSRYRPAVAAA